MHHPGGNTPREREVMALFYMLVGDGACGGVTPRRWLRAARSEADARHADTTADDARPRAGLLFLFGRLVATRLFLLFRLRASLARRSSGRLCVGDTAPALEGFPALTFGRTALRCLPGHIGAAVRSHGRIIVRPADDIQVPFDP